LLESIWKYTKIGSEKKEMNGKEKCLPKDFGSVFQEALGVRLRNLEAFVYHSLDKEREFATYEVKDRNGKTKEHTITEMEAFETIFGRHEDIEDTFQGLKNNVSDIFRESAEAEQQAQEAQERQSKRVAEFKAAEAIKAKELEALKAEGAKRRREAYRLEHVEELRRIALEREREEAYQKELEKAAENKEEVYIGGRLKKLD
jgi:hypothetical protein